MVNERVEKGRLQEKVDLHKYGDVVALQSVGHNSLVKLAVSFWNIDS